MTLSVSEFWLLMSDKHKVLSSITHLAFKHNFLFFRHRKAQLESAKTGKARKKMETIFLYNHAVSHSHLSPDRILKIGQCHIEIENLHTANQNKTAQG